MSARPVVKTSHMPAAMQEFAIMAAQVCSPQTIVSTFLIFQSIFQDAIANFTTEQEIAASIKSKFEHQYPST